jgi:hypothetical protein
MKVCSKCKQEKELNQFYKSKRPSHKDGYNPQCKMCLIGYSNNLYQKNKDYWVKRSSQWNKENKEHISKYMSDYFKQNKEKIYDARRKYIKERYDNDPLFKLTQKTRTIISNSLRKNKHKKISSTQEILGCTFEELKKHLESQFEPWMNWGNMGKKQINTPNTSWEVDHIIPISSAKTEEEVVRLNHYTNLRPLCSYTNRFIKRNK